MGLQIDLLEKPRTIDGVRIQARCPACAESGGDTKGEHLVVYPNGSFGCCIYPGDKQHRRQIFALVGKKRSIPVITVRRASRDQPARQWTSVSVTLTLPAPPTAANPDSELPVPSVPNQSLALKGPRLFIDSSGGLVIPSNSPARYHYWKGGQSVDETLNEIQSAGAFSTFTAAQVAVPNQPP